MERRTSCLQSNVDFLQKTINKLTLDHQQKLDAANRQIEALKGSVVALQKIVDDLQADGGGSEEESRSAAGEGCCAGGQGCGSEAARSREPSAFRKPGIAP